MSTPDEELAAQPGLLESLKNGIADRSHFIAGRPERKRAMKTKVIEHEYTVTFPDGDTETSAAVAIRRWPGEYSLPNGDGSPGESVAYTFAPGWEIDGTTFSIASAADAREYIKLLEKIIEAEESGD